MLSSSFYNDNRLATLEAAQQGDIDTIRELLTKTPELIKSTTSTKHSSLLHIAAERGHEAICKLLLELGHCTNPVDIEGKTPYQRAKSPEIKSLLATKHKDFLCQKYFNASSVEFPQKDFITNVTEEILVLNENDFLQFVQSKIPGILQECTFLSAATFLQFEKDTHSSGRFIGKLTTLFREDILMLPYYGDVLVIHENEQVHQNKEFLDLANKVSDHGKAINMLKNLIESRAFITSSAKGIELFPFLAEYPRKEDTAEIVEAKKIFIAFNLIGGCLEYFPQCSEEHQNNLKELNEYKRIIHDAGHILANPKSIENMCIFGEMNNKYGLNKTNTLQKK